MEDRRSTPTSASALKKLRLDCGTGQNSISIQIKKSVRFNEQMLEEVIVFEDDDASKQARMTYWQFVALDRQRFKDRVKSLEEVLSPILANSHRDRIYTRMADSSLPTKPSSVKVKKIETVISADILVVLGNSNQIHQAEDSGKRDAPSFRTVFWKDDVQTKL